MTTYVTLFDPIPWPAVGISFLQTFIIYWVVLLGLKLLGRRSFGQLGPQELILLLLISEATDLGLTHLDSGFWGSLASVIALLLTVYLVDQIPLLSAFLESSPVVIVEKGQIKTEALQKFQISEKDLNHAAREHGVYDPSQFDLLVLESDGKLAGVLKKEETL